MRVWISDRIGTAWSPGPGGLGSDPAPVWLLLSGLAVALGALGLVSTATAQPVALTLIATLAAFGLLFLLAALTGRIVIAGRAASARETVIDLWPEPALLTSRFGGTLHANSAFERTVGTGGQGGLQALEAWFAGDAAASEALFRLVRAGERGETLAEEVDVEIEDEVGERSRRLFRIAVSPVAAGRIAIQPAVLWRLEDVTADRERLRAGEIEAASRHGMYNWAPVGLLSLSADGAIGQMNDTMHRLLGAPMAGQEPLGLEALFARAGADAVRRHVETSGASGFQCGLDLITRSGRRLPVRLVASPPPPVGADRAGRVLAVIRSDWIDTALAGGEGADRSFARQFESAPFGIATVTARGVLARANPAFSQMVVGMAAGRENHVLDVLCRDASPEARSELEQSLADALAGQADLAPVDFTVNGKSEMGRRVYITPMAAASGSREAAILYVVDTTEQKALEAKFAQSQKMEAVGKLAGGIAHDFNNVLTAIIGSADLMLQTHRASDAAHKDIQNIKQSANRAAALVGKLMAFSRQQTLKLELLPLGDVMTDLRPMLKTSLGEKIDLEIQNGRDLWYVRADRTQVDQVIVNFAVNAQHAMPDGGKFWVRTRNVSEREVQKLAYPGMVVGEYVLIEVEDTGTGMPPEVLAKIFEPFFTTKDVGKGTGLGLATVYGIVKQSSGYIFADSTVGKGTTFRVFLPRANVDSEAELPIAKAKKADQTADLTGNATVLIVEDEDMVRSVAVRSLTRFGYTVLEAGNGVEALEVLAGNKVDIVVSDVVMPEMDGPAFLKAVRRTHPDLKIIFVSGHTNEAFRATVGEDETFAFLPKPFSLPQLAAKVKEELAR